MKARPLDRLFRGLRVGESPTRSPRKIARVSELYNGSSGSKRASLGQIKYFGGRLVAGAPINVYLIFYGAWAGSESGPTILSNFIRSLSDTSVPKPSVANWWNISTGYYMKDRRGNKKYVSAQVRVAVSDGTPGLPGGRHLHDGHGELQVEALHWQKNPPVHSDLHLILGPT